MTLLFHASFRFQTLNGNVETSWERHVPFAWLLTWNINPAEDAIGDQLGRRFEVGCKWDVRFVATGNRSGRAAKRKTSGRKRLHWGIGLGDPAPSVGGSVPKSVYGIPNETIVGG